MCLACTPVLQGPLGGLQEGRHSILHYKVIGRVLQITGNSSLTNLREQTCPWALNHYQGNTGGEKVMSRNMDEQKDTHLGRSSWRHQNTDGDRDRVSV